MLGFLIRRVLPWVLLAIAAPLMRIFIRRMFRVAIRHAVVKPTAKALRETDAAATDVSQNGSRQVKKLSPAKF